MKNKAVVFGGSGFLGSHVADALSRAGHEVTVFDIYESKYLQNNQKMVTGDILDFDLVADTVSGADYVYNFAAIADIGQAAEDPIKTIKYNVLGNANILEACREKKVKRFLFGSTIYVYSQHGSFYRTSKQAAELLIENYSKDFGLEYTILRYGSLYGPRANKFNFINNIVNQAILEKKITREGDGGELRDYIHVEDAADASVQVLSDEYINSNVMITGDKSMRVRDLLEMIREIFNNEVEIIYNDSNLIHHYDFTPYSFKPRVAKKIQLKNHHDLGQGILDIIYQNYEQLKDKDGNK